MTSGMKTLSLVIISIITSYYLSGCAYGPFSDTGSTFIETVEGDKLDCVTDLEACTKTCDVVYKGNKVKRSYPLKPDKCPKQ